jgi:hypothetical protein
MIFSSLSFGCKNQLSGGSCLAADRDAPTHREWRPGLTRTGF